MRTRHTSHSLSGFPVFSAAFVAEDRLVLGGGGGSSRSGVKNKLRLYNVTEEKFKLLNELELGKDEDSPMSMAGDVFASRVVCGINSSTEQLAMGINENCRLYDAAADELDLLDSRGTLQTEGGVDADDYQKVSVISPVRTMVCVSGMKRLSLLSYPSLSRVARDLITKDEFYDASISSSKLALVTNKDLFIYSLPASETKVSEASTSRPRTRSKAKNQSPTVLQELKILDAFARPNIPGEPVGSTTLRACRFNPADENVVYTVSNTTPGRQRGKSKPKQGYICKWNATTWTVSCYRKIGEKGITCFDVSINGKYLAVGSADCTIAVLNAKTLAPLISIPKAHGLPPTVVRFSPSARLMVSGSADNSIRIVSIPEGLKEWSISNFAFLLFFVFIFVLVMQYILFVR